MSVMVWVSLVVGLVILTLGSDLLVRGASRLALAMGITPLVIGLTVVAFGTSAPELAVSLQGALSGTADVALGNVVGSNTFNILFILGVSALIAPLAVNRQLLRVDVPLMIAASVFTYLIARDGVIGRLEGGALFAGIIIYTWRAIKLGMAGSAANAADEAAELDGAEPPRTAAQTARELGFMVAGLAMMVLGARWFVSGAVDIARWAGMSELVIGLTIVAVGTSLPEVATSIMATLRGERDIAVGNVIGSNIFNLFSVLGASSLITPIKVAPAALALDLPVMIGAALICLPIFFTQHIIDRLEGAVFLLAYVLYVAFLIMSNMQSAALPTLLATLPWLGGAVAIFLLATTARQLIARPHAA